MDPDAIKTVAECLRTLPWWGAILLVLVFGLWRFFNWLDRRLERRHKDARAEKYVAVIEGLSHTIRSHELSEHERSTRVEGTARDIRAEVRRCVGAVDNLAMRARGAMSPVASLRLVQAYYGVVCAAIQRVVEQSLWEQDPAPPSAHTSRRLRTLMAAALGQARESLRSIRQVSIPLDHFFPTYTERKADTGASGGERYHLVDLIWQEVEPFFSMPAGGHERADAVNLTIDNTVCDYLSALIAAYRDEHPEAFKARDPTMETSGPYPAQDIA
jgi:hypothetical protein